MKKVLAVALVVASVPLALLALFAATPSGACEAENIAAPEVPLDAEQSANARTVIAVGQHMAVPAAAMVVAIAAAMQESGLRNLTYGDRDSVGLFQQRPSQGWGSPAQLLDPRYAAARFYTALLEVPDWQTLPVAVAAQAVQRSAFPSAYARWAFDAAHIVSALAAYAGVACAAGASDSLTHAVDFAASQVGDAYVLGANGPDVWDCSSLVQAAFAAAGVNLPRTAVAQYEHLRGRGLVATGPAHVSRLLAGDLLFSRGSRPNIAGDGAPIGHVALYAGDGVVIEAKGSSWGVTSRQYSENALASTTWIGRITPVAATPTTIPAHTTNIERSLP